MFNVLVIAREYGSGGSDIGHSVVDLLNWECIANLENEIQQLYDAGGRYFLVVLLPKKIPAFSEHSAEFTTSTFLMVEGFAISCPLVRCRRPRTWRETEILLLTTKLSGKA
jgi:hypothetical protein